MEARAFSLGEDAPSNLSKPQRQPIGGASIGKHPSLYASPPAAIAKLRGGEREQPHQQTANANTSRPTASTGSSESKPEPTTPRQQRQRPRVATRPPLRWVHTTLTQPQPNACHRFMFLSFILCLPVCFFEVHPQGNARSSLSSIFSSVSSDPSSFTVFLCHTLALGHLHALHTQRTWSTR